MCVQMQDGYQVDLQPTGQAEVVYKQFAEAIQLDGSRPNKVKQVVLGKT